MNIVVVSYNSLCCIVYCSTVEKKCNSRATMKGGKITVLPCQCRVKGLVYSPHPASREGHNVTMVRTEGVNQLAVEVCGLSTFLGVCSRRKSGRGLCLEHVAMSRLPYHEFRRVFFFFFFFFSPVFFLLPAKVGRGCLTSTSCLESQGSHLVSLSYLLSYSPT